VPAGVAFFQFVGPAKAADARFDHFGLFSIYPGGQIVRMYVDDLEYTIRRD
jgi:hypothetical protein